MKITLGKRRTALLAINDIEPIGEICDHIVDLEIEPLVVPRGTDV